MRVQGEKYQELALIVTSHDFHFTMAIFFILEVVTNIEQNHPNLKGVWFCYGGTCTCLNPKVKHNEEKSVRWRIWIPCLWIERPYMY